MSMKFERDERKFDFHDIGCEIKRKRETSGMTQDQLALIIDRDPRTIIYNENDGQHPSLNTFYQMVTMFDISVDHFFYPDMSADAACKKRINTLSALTLDRFGYWCYTLNIIKEIVHMRQYNNLSQNELADISGVRQPMIARIEHGINTPNMSTVLKLLAAFGKTLYIGDLKNVELEDGADSVAADEDLTTE